MVSQPVSTPRFELCLLRANTRSGFHATTVAEFAEGYEKALTVSQPLAMRLRARESAKRFTEEEFARLWLIEMERLIKLTK
jgi:alpha-1,2-mannosyltransferase